MIEHYELVLFYCLYKQVALFTGEAALRYTLCLLIYGEGIEV